MSFVLNEIATSLFNALFSLNQARKLCSFIETIPYEFEKYKQMSLQMYTILMANSDDLQAVSVDEALIDVSSGVRQLAAEKKDTGYSDPAKGYAEMLRTKIQHSTGCEGLSVQHFSTSCVTAQ